MTDQARQLQAPPSLSTGHVFVDLEWRRYPSNNTTKDIRSLCLVRTPGNELAVVGYHTTLHVPKLQELLLQVDQGAEAFAGMQGKELR